MLKAKVKDGCRFAPIISCSGVMFSVGRFSLVPVGFEQEAKNNPYLDVSKMAEDDELLKPPPPPPAPKEVAEEIEIVGEPDESEDAAPSFFDVVDDGMPNATPAAIELATSMKLKLSWVTGTGKDGKIVQKDVEDYLAQKEAKAEAKE